MRHFSPMGREKEWSDIQRIFTEKPIIIDNKIRTETLSEKFKSNIEHLASRSIYPSIQTWIEKFKAVV